MFSKCVFGKGKLSSGIGILRHHVGIRKRNDNHDQSTQYHSNRCPGHAGIREKFLSRVDKGAPADYAAESDRPNVHRR